MFYQCNTGTQSRLQAQRATQLLAQPDSERFIGKRGRCILISVRFEQEPV